MKLEIEANVSFESVVKYFEEKIGYELRRFKTFMAKYEKMFEIDKEEADSFRKVAYSHHLKACDNAKILADLIGEDATFVIKVLNGFLFKEDFGIEVKG